MNNTTQDTLLTYQNQQQHYSTYTEIPKSTITLLNIHRNTKISNNTTQHTQKYQHQQQNYSTYTNIPESATTLFNIHRNTSINNNTTQNTLTNHKSSETIFSLFL